MEKAWMFMGKMHRMANPRKTSMATIRSFSCTGSGTRSNLGNSVTAATALMCWLLDSKENQRGDASTEQERQPVEEVMTPIHDFWHIGLAAARAII
jgi:hypothetical protein